MPLAVVTACQRQSGSTGRGICKTVSTWLRRLTEHTPRELPLDRRTSASSRQPAHIRCPPRMPSLCKPHSRCSVRSPRVQAPHLPQPANELHTDKALQAAVPSHCRPPPSCTCLSQLQQVVPLVRHVLLRRPRQEQHLRQQRPARSHLRGARPVHHGHAATCRPGALRNRQVPCVGLQLWTRNGAPWAQGRTDDAHVSGLGLQDKDDEQWRACLAPTSLVRHG